MRGDNGPEPATDSWLSMAQVEQTEQQVDGTPPPWKQGGEERQSVSPAVERPKRSLTPLVPPRKPQAKRRPPATPTGSVATVFARASAASSNSTVSAGLGETEARAGHESTAASSSTPAASMRFPIRTKQQWNQLSTATRLEEAGRRVAFWTAQMSRAAEELEMDGDGHGN